MNVLPTVSLETPSFCCVPTFMRLPQVTSLKDLAPAIIGLRSDGGGPYRTGACDMDVVDPSAAPAVQTPVSGGPAARETLQIIRALHGIDLIGCDVEEANPLYDSTAQITALPAATVMAKLLALLASRRSSSAG